MIPKPFAARTASLGLVLIAGHALAMVPVLAVDFRVENRVYSGSQTQPDLHSTTIFAGRNVYDFLEDPAEVTVFEPTAQHYILLDFSRRVRTELSTGEVDSFVGEIQQYAVRHKDPAVRFLGDPKFEEKFDSKTSDLMLASERMSYRARLLAVGPEVAQQYRAYSDAQTRLNTVLNPGSRPPQARIWLNEAIVRHQAMAKEVQLTLKLKSGSATKSVTVRSQHELALALTPDDNDRVVKAREAMQSFTLVSFTAYAKNGSH